ncbi:MAG: NgoMIV family type II restriction endonuclease [Chloroflexi bacterium]|nr:NgoMIV family type II restriction endonuclease [Chloroflexota bacterium]
MDARLLRNAYHHGICKEIIRVSKDTKREVEYPNFADGSSKASVAIAWEIVTRLGYARNETHLQEQTAGNRFEQITRSFLEQSSGLLSHIRPGQWQYLLNTAISGFSQYEHLAYLEEVISRDKTLSATLRGDYIVHPDIVIARVPVSDDEINRAEPVIRAGDSLASLTPLRQANVGHGKSILHASISCKWTIRSDRSQNTRTEAMNLVRHRKGHLPHVVAVTAEPLPTRLAALALGTGDLDCVYHFALYELVEAVNAIQNEDQEDMLRTMIDGKRLRDISDLPFDLAA